MKLKLEIDLDYEIDEDDLNTTIRELMHRQIITKVQWHPEYRAMVETEASKLLDKLKEK